MKKLTLLLLPYLYCSLSVAQTPLPENRVIATEVERIIVNYNPGPVIAGRAILFTCQTCEPQTVEFTQDTELFIEGQSLPISEIGRQVDWAGVVTVMSQSPERVVRFTMQ